MKSPQISRRSFIRLLTGLFPFVPVARSLTTLPFQSTDGTGLAISREVLEQDLKGRIAKGNVLTLEGDSIWIRDQYADKDKVRLVITDESLVWKGKYNKGKQFDSYPYLIDPGDAVIARGQRNGDEFIVERMYANILNTYVTVDETSLGKDEVVIFYTDEFKKKGTVKVRPDYLSDKTLYKEVVGKHQQFRGKTVQVIGLPLKDGTIIATNLFT